MAKTEEVTIAEVYAWALLELANEQGLADTIELELRELVEQIRRDPEPAAFIASRAIDADARRKSLDRMFQGRLSNLLVDTLQVLNKKHRLHLLGYVQQQYHRMFVEQQNIAEVRVMTAAPLSEELRARVQQIMEERTRQIVKLIEKIEPAVLGGVVVRTGDEQIDVSVARQLRRFHDTLVEHASRHIHAGTNLFEGATTY